MSCVDNHFLAEDIERRADCAVMLIPDDILLNNRVFRDELHVERASDRVIFHAARTQRIEKCRYAECVLAVVGLAEQDYVGIDTYCFVYDGRESVFHVLCLHPHVKLHHAQFTCLT